MEIARQLALFLDNRPGTLARVCDALQEAKVNIEYCYSATNPSARNGLVVLRVSDVKRALKTLNLQPA